MHRVPLTSGRVKKFEIFFWLQCQRGGLQRPLYGYPNIPHSDWQPAAAPAELFVVSELHPRRKQDDASSVPLRHACISNNANREHGRRLPAHQTEHYRFSLLLRCNSSHRKGFHRSCPNHLLFLPPAPLTQKLIPSRIPPCSLVALLDGGPGVASHVVLRSNVGCAFD